ncbi:MAG: energy transducer TonB [Rhodothermales bacterium]
MKRVLFTIVILFLFQGCTSEEPFEFGPPVEWEGVETTWWKIGQDTTHLFRDLETLEDMKVAGADDVYLTNAALTASRDARKQFAKAVKRSLIRMYRNEPAVVDSLFEKFLVPKIEEVKFTSDPVKDVETFKKTSYKLLSRHFREPRTRLDLGTDVIVVYPDSIRMQGIEGSVKLQVYLDDEGNPLTVELVDSVHPVLDQLALVATTEMRWLPAYVEHKRDWKPIPSWTRFRITFKTS